MSFLNPVNEPVKRFSSTDAGAPQINYATRVAGDVKTVLKACLVTGYGAKASAGWSIVNEVNHVAEFVSPSVAMSDYRLGIDDTSASSTTWYYQYQDARVNPLNNQPLKSFSQVNSEHASNGWQLIVTERGLYFVEFLHYGSISNVVARVTCWGSIKSALVNSSGANMSFWCGGYNSPIGDPTTLFDSDASRKTHYRIAGHTSAQFSGAGVAAAALSKKAYGLSTIDLTCELFLESGSVVLGQQVGLMLQSVNTVADAYGVKDTLINDRPLLKVGITIDSIAEYLPTYARVFLIPLDYWEY